MSRRREFGEGYLHLYHGTDEGSAMKIDTEGLKSNMYGGVYGSENINRAVKRAHERGEETGNAPRLVEFYAAKENLSRPMSERHDWFHQGDIPVEQIKDITEL